MNKFFEQEYVVKKMALCSVAGSLVFAHFYALFERWFNFSQVKSDLSFIHSVLPSFGVLEPYNYLFMTALFLFVSILPLTPLIASMTRNYKVRLLSIVLGNVFLIALVEDMAYFYLYGTWIQPWNWTANVAGFFTAWGFLVPNWYPPIILVISSLYVFGCRWRRKCST